jgi:hypothetical protein
MIDVTLRTCVSLSCWWFELVSRRRQPLGVIWSYKAYCKSVDITATATDTAHEVGSKQHRLRFQAAAIMDCVHRYSVPNKQDDDRGPCWF